MTQWRRMRLKHLAAVPIVNGVGEPGEYEEPDWPRYVRTTDIAGPRRLRDDVFKSLPPAVASRASLVRGDLLMVAAGATIGKSYLHESDKPACFAGYLVRFRPREDIDARFVTYWTESALYWQQIDSQHVKATIENFSAARYRNLVVDVPPYEEQRRIAEYLDLETTRIDGLIHAKKRLLGLFHERWKNEVIKAVTRGVSNEALVPMDSPWFDRLPANWALEPLKRRWTVVDCKHRTAAYVDQGYPLVSHAEIDDGRVHPGRSGRFVAEVEYLDLIEGRRPQRGDIIYTRNAAIGNAGYIDTDEDFAMGQDVCLITSDDQDQRFLTYLLNHVVVGQLAAQRLGATFGRINVAQIVDLQIACPPPEDQRAIADYLDARRKTYETLAAQLRRQAELLAEHREALITAAVTGRIEVMGGAA